MNVVGWTDGKEVNALKICFGNWSNLCGRKKWM